LWRKAAEEADAQRVNYERLYQQLLGELSALASDGTLSVAELQQKLNTLLVAHRERRGHEQSADYSWSVDGGSQAGASAAHCLGAAALEGLRRSSECVLTAYRHVLAEQIGLIFVARVVHEPTQLPKRDGDTRGRLEILPCPIDELHGPPAHGSMALLESLQPEIRHVGERRRIRRAGNGQQFAIRRKRHWPPFESQTCNLLGQQQPLRVLSIFEVLVSTLFEVKFPFRFPHAVGESGKRKWEPSVRRQHRVEGCCAEHRKIKVG
jgi:hypothetical protein